MTCEINLCNLNRDAVDAALEGVLNEFTYTKLLTYDQKLHEFIAELGFATFMVVFHGEPSVEFGFGSKTFSVVAR